MCELWYRAPTRYHVPSRGATGFAKIALMLAMSAVTTAAVFCAATMRIGVTLSMPSATVLTIFVKPICLIFGALQRAEVPLFCFNVRASERSRIHRLLQRGQKCSCNHDRDHDIRRRGHQLRQICHKCRNADGHCLW